MDDVDTAACAKSSKDVERFKFVVVVDVDDDDADVDVFGDPRGDECGDPSRDGRGEFGGVNSTSSLISLSGLESRS